MPYPIRRFIVELYFGKFWHFEKIADAVAKKFETLITEKEIEEFVGEVDGWLRRKEKSPGN